MANNPYLDVQDLVTTIAQNSRTQIGSSTDNDTNSSTKSLDHTESTPSVNLKVAVYCKK